MALAIDVQTLLSFALASLLIELTPGPNMTYLAVISAAEGRRAGLATVAGVTLGLAIVGTVAAFGLAEAIQASDMLYEALRWGGVLFLFYLAWDGWTAASAPVESDEKGAARHFLRGLMTNLLNPKAAVFYIAVLPTFLDATRPILPQTLSLTAVYVAVATVVHLGIVALAGAAEPFLNDPRRERIARRVLSLLLAGVAVWFLVSTRR